MRLRSDDPSTMKNFIVSIQNKVTEQKAASKDTQGNTRSKRVCISFISINQKFQSVHSLLLFPLCLLILASFVSLFLHGWQMEFMLETITDIKNNKKKAKEDTLQHTRIKKWLQKVII